jgi:hypothetical protein
MTVPGTGNCHLIFFISYNGDYSSTQEVQQKTHINACYNMLNIIQKATLDPDGYATCPDCKTRIHCGSVGLSNLEKNHHILTVT